MDPIDATAGEASSGDGSDPDGEDETGGGLHAVEGTQCLFDPIEGLYGYRYQCEGSVALDVLIEHAFDGPPVTLFLALDFGQGVEGDSYEDPLVMACCPWYETGPYARNCDQPHERACLIGHRHHRTRV